MKKILVIMAYICCFTSMAAAQKVSTLSKLYSHTVNFEGYKALFHVSDAVSGPHHADIEKKYYWYSSNMINVTYGGYSGRPLDGVYQEFYLNKNLKTQGTFDEGLKVGEWRSWNEQGGLDSLMHFSSGVLNGQFAAFGANGQPALSGKYKSGKKSGKWLKFIKADSAQVVHYKKGKAVELKTSKLKKWMRKMISHLSLKKQHAKP